MKKIKNNKLILSLLYIVFSILSLLFVYVLLHLVLGFSHYISMASVFLVTFFSRKNKKSWIISLSRGVISGILIILVSIGFYRHLIYENAVLRHYFPKTQASNANIILENEDLYTMGEEVVVPVRIESPDNSVNVASVVLSYNPNDLRVLEIIDDDSHLSISVLNYIDQDKGEVRTVVAEPNPGFTHSNGHLFDVRVVFIKDGSVDIKVGSESTLMKNDGFGTNIRMQENIVYSFEVNKNYDQFDQNDQILRSKVGDLNNITPFKEDIWVRMVKKIPENLAHSIYDSNDRIISLYSRFF